MCHQFAAEPTGDTRLNIVNPTNWWRSLIDTLKSFNLPTKYIQETNRWHIHVHLTLQTGDTHLSYTLKSFNLPTNFIKKTNRWHPNV